MKGWKLSSVLAKKSSPEGWPGDAGKNLVEADFFLPATWGPTLQRGAVKKVQ